MKETVAIPYGNDVIPVSVRKDNLQGILYPNNVEKCDEVSTLKDAISNPINSKRFDQFISDARDILFIVNDATRPTPTAKIVDILYEQIRDKNVKFIIATGIHREPTREEYEYIFGRYYELFKDRIFSHDSRKDEDMVYLGDSRNGTQMWINKMAIEAHKIVIIGSVEPHYFGGYSGGRKSLLPGIASYSTIEQNHKLATSPGARVLALEGNPINEDMEDAIDAIGEKDLFCILTVVDREYKVCGATSGDIHGSFEIAVQKANEVFCVKIDSKADIVVTVVPRPLDIVLYQSQKGIYNGILALKEGGILILISACHEGTGPDTYVRMLSSCDSPKQVLEKIESEEYKLGYHQAAKIAEISLWAQIWAVTKIDDKTMESIFIRPFSNPQQAIDVAINEKGRGCKILFLMDGAFTVPILN